MIKIQRFCLDCREKFETEDKRNAWGMSMSSMRCPKCADKFQKKIAEENKKVESQIKN